MTENKFDKAKITDDEWEKVKISRVNTRPNAKSSYGTGSYTASDTKALFDKQGDLFRLKHNALVNYAREEEAARADAEAKRAEAENLRAAAEGSVDENSEYYGGRALAEAQRGEAEAERVEAENLRAAAEGSVDEGSEYYGGRALAEKERRDNEEMRKEFYKTAFVGKKSDYVGGGVFNTEYATDNEYNLANARAATTFGYDNRIVNNETDLKATYAHKLFEDDYVPKEDLDNESKWGRHSFLAGGNNVLTAYSGVGLGEANKICGSRAVAIGFALRAYSAMQFICGKCNVPDYPLDGQKKECNDSSLTGKYVFIVGNGYSNNPSNAFAVDWDGNAYISNELYFGEVSLTTKINNAIEKLINGAPGTMDTFAEIAKFIGSEDKEATILGDIAKNATRISMAEALIEEHTKEIENLQARLDGLVSAEGVSF